MGKSGDYSIKFLGISDGRHEFNFHINKDLFLQYDNDSIKDADIEITVDFEKNVRFLSLSFDIKGSVETLCDRCLDTLNLNIDYSPALHVNFGDYTSDLTDIDDVMTLSRSEDTLDLSKHFYDYIMLNIPIQKVHSQENGDKCNDEMLARIEKYEIGNNNLEQDEIDPRWDKLKHLYN